MKIFFDTSAFAKRYINEAGSEEVDSLCFQATEICISILCIPEMISTLSRLVRERKINRRQYNEIKKVLYSDLGTITVCNITPSVVENSIILLERNVLKAMDSLQLACALEMNVDSFISSDIRQVKAAKKSKLKSIQI